MTSENNVPQQENQVKENKLEIDTTEFASLIDTENFSEAKSLAKEILKVEGDLTQPPAQAILNGVGYEVVDKYLHSNKEKARRICEAFPEYSWQNWLK